jgi:hypothetical protein
MPRRSVALVVVLVLATAWLAFAFRGPLSRATIAAVIDVASGYRVSFDALTVSAADLHLEGVHVRRGGDPVLDAKTLDVAYSLRDALPGGTRRFGLRSIDIEDAALWIVRNRDGSLNVGGNVSAPRAQAAAKTGGAPWRFVARINGGSLTILDPYRVYAGSRKIIVGHLHANARVDSSAYTHYAVRGQLVTDDTLHAPVPCSLVGTIDRARGYGLHHLLIGRLPLRDFVNYVMNSATAYLFAGEAKEIDLRAYALDLASAHPAGYHLSGGIDVTNGVLYVPGIVRPIHDLHGRLNVFDGGLAAKRLDGTLSGLPLRAAGSIFDWSKPTFSLTAIARGPVASARTLFNFSQHLPLAGGTMAVRLLLEGPVQAPLVRTAIAAPLVTYSGIPLHDVSGEVDYYNSSVTLMPVRLSYGPLAVNVHGPIDLNVTADSDLMFDAAAPPRSLPYVAQTLPAVPLHVDGTIVGNDINVDARGVFAGDGGGDRIAGLFHVDKHGDGMFGPAEIERSDGTSLAGAYYLDRSHSQSGFWVDGRNFLLKGNPHHPTLPGIERFAPPEFDGVIDGAVAGAGTPSTFQIAGRVHVHNVAYGTLKFDDIRAAIGGPIAEVRLAGVSASGPWGSFSGAGAYGNGRIALQGTYRGSFERLRDFTGDVGAKGDVAGPVALIVDSQRTLVQARGIASPDGTVAGIPVDRLRGTLALDGKTLRVYAATGEVAGGNFVADGALGAGRSIGVSLAGANARDLRRAGSPLESGSVDAIGSVAYSGRVPTFSGGISIDAGRAGGIDIAGDGDVRADVHDATVSEAKTLFGQAYGVVDGTIAGFGESVASYNFAIHARDVAIAPFARMLVPKRHDIAGLVNSTLTVSGRGGAPSVSGSIEMPEGTFNGQAFADLHAQIGAGSGGISATGGSILVGETRANFGATLAGANASLDLDIPKAQMSDFDDLFDTGDTLGGNGRIEGHFLKRGEEVVTNADVQIAGLRYRLYDFGDAHAHWVSSGRNVKTLFSLGGASGTLKAAGTLTLPATAEFDRLLQRASFDGTAQLKALDLGVWLPLLGYELPVAGRIDAQATLHGPLQSPLVHTDATIVDGRVWKFPVERASFAFDTTLTRTTIHQAEVDLPNVALRASGSFGFTAESPVEIAFHATSSDVGALAQRVYGAQLPLTGAAEVDFHVDGSRRHPHVIGGFELEKGTYRGVAVPRALGELTLQDRDLVLSDAEVLFAKGGLYLPGSVPLQFSPLGLGPPKSPLALEIQAKGIDLTDFAPLLPQGSTLSGTLDGRIALNGTAGDPELVGDLGLTGGTIESPYESIPLTNVRGSLSVASKTLALTGLHAETAGGTFDANGAATLGDLVHPAEDATYDFHATAKALRLDLPAFGQGQIDGTLSIVHTPGRPALVSGTDTISNAIIPFSALLLASGSTTSAAGTVIPTVGAPPVALPEVNLAFDLTAIAGNNVRVRSTNVDIGSRGQLHVGGTRGALALDGQFDSTGGTLSYFNTVFRVDRANVRFRPDQGVIPALDAEAITHVIDPDPNTLRNPSGTADITLDVTGPVTNLNVQINSDPPYDRQTILGLLLNAPAFGATNMFSTATPGQATVPAGVVSRSGATGELGVGQEAFGVLNAQFTRNLLSPIETQVGGALGLTNLAFNIDYGGGFGLSARKVLGKNIYLLYGQSFSYPYRQTFGFDIKPNPVTAAQITVFETIGAQGFGAYAPINLSLQPINQRVLLAQPIGGTSGFSFSLQRLFP